MKYKTVLKILSVVSFGLLLGTSPIISGSSNGYSLNNSLWNELPEYYGIPYNPNQKQIQDKIREIVKNPGELDEITHNAKFYLYYVFAQAKVRHMPTEIALIPMIESNYNPFVYSNVGATGLWQLMPETGSGYGLHMDWWYDGRRDVIGSTNASLNYFMYLHKRFKGNWLLAIAAYNAGEGTVEAAIQKNQRLHKPTDFWDLPLPADTKAYVPKLLALAQIIKNPKKYHVQLDPVKNTPYFQAISVFRSLDITEIATLANVNVNLIRALNPGLRRWATDPEDNAALLLPVDKINTFAENLNKDGYSYENTRLTYPHMVRHKVVKAVAKAQIAALSKEKVAHPVVLAAHTSPKNITEDNIPGPIKLTYTVAPHDSLPKIAAIYGVDSNDLRFWNHLKDNFKLHTGEKIVVWRRHYTEADHAKTLAKLADAGKKTSDNTKAGINPVQFTAVTQSAVIVGESKAII